VAAFNNDFFAYTTGRDASYAVTGTLVAVTGATAANCPAGRILRETGRKMYPGNAYPGVSTYMVSVYDDQSLLGGFIDPNSPVFAVSNSDKPSYLANPTNPRTGGLADAGQPVYTNGGVTMTGGSLIQYRPVTTLASTTPLTLTANNVPGVGAAATTGGILGGILTQNATGTNKIVNLPSTASLLAALGSKVGASTDFIFNELGGGQQSVLTAGDANTTFVSQAGITSSFGVSQSGTAVARFTIVVTSATTIVIYVNGQHV
jgi:hypothetical protein